MHEDTSLTRPTLAYLRAAYSDEKRQRERRFLWVPLVRIPSFYLAWLFVRLGISANQTTYLGLALGLLGCLLLASGWPGGMFAGAILANAWFLFDCVDGNIARYHRASSVYGQFIDNLGGYTMYGFLFISIGAGLYRYQVIYGAPPGLLGFALGLSIEPGVYLAAGSLASLASLLHAVIFLNFSTLFAAQETDVPTDPLLRQRWRLVFFLYANVTNFCGLVLPLLALAVLARALDVYVLFYGAIYLAVLLFNTARLLAQARSRFNG